MRTIKVIDLLNKIANSEEVPKKIMYDEKIFEYDELEKCYITDNFDHTTVNDLSIYLDGYKQSTLNDEVEIIEEPEEKEIKKINYKLLKYYDMTDFHRDYKESAECVKELCDRIEPLELKINELVEVVNELRKEK